MSGAGAQFMQYGGRAIPIWFCNSFANTFDNLYIFQFGAHVRKFEQQARETSLDQSMQIIVFLRCYNFYLAISLLPKHRK